MDKNVCRTYIRNCGSMTVFASILLSISELQNLKKKRKHGKYHGHSLRAVAYIVVEEFLALYSIQYTISA